VKQFSSTYSCTYIHTYIQVHIRVLAGFGTFGFYMYPFKVRMYLLKSARVLIQAWNPAVCVLPYFMPPPRSQNPPTRSNKAEAVAKSPDNRINRYM